MLRRRGIIMQGSTSSGRCESDRDLVEIIYRADHFVFDVIAADEIIPGGKFMIRNIELIEEQDIAVAQVGREAGQCKKGR